MDEDLGSLLSIVADGADPTHLYAFDPKHGGRTDRIMVAMDRAGSVAGIVLGRIDHVDSFYSFVETGKFVSKGTSPYVMDGIRTEWMGLSGWFSTNYHWVSRFHQFGKAPAAIMDAYRIQLLMDRNIDMFYWTSRPFSEAFLRRKYGYPVDFQRMVISTTKMTQTFNMNLIHPDRLVEYWDAKYTP